MRRKKSSTIKRHNASNIAWNLAGAIGLLYLTWKYTVPGFVVLRDYLAGKATNLSATAHDASRVTEPTATKEWDPVTFQEYLLGIKNQNLTDIQRDEFIKSHNQRRVKWEGYVLDVSEASVSTGEVCVSLAPEDIRSRRFFGNFALAFFRGGPRRELLALEKGQRVQVSGVLEAGKMPHTPVLADAQLEDWD